MKCEEWLLPKGNEYFVIWLGSRPIKLPDSQLIEMTCVSGAETQKQIDWLKANYQLDICRYIKREKQNIKWDMLDDIKIEKTVFQALLIDRKTREKIPVKSRPTELVIWLRQRTIERIECYQDDGDGNFEKAFDMRSPNFRGDKTDSLAD